MASYDQELASIAEDGNFKRGRFKPAAVVLALLAAIGGGAALFVGLQKDSTRITPQQIADEKRTLALLPRADQLPKWREWALRGDAPKMQEEAFAQLAWAKDPAGLDVVIKGLESVDHRVRGTAAQALSEYGPMADKAKPALLKALG